MSVVWKIQGSVEARTGRRRSRRRDEHTELLHQWTIDRRSGDTRSVCESDRRGNRSRVGIEAGYNNREPVSSARVRARVTQVIRALRVFSAGNTEVISDVLVEGEGEAGWEG